MKIVISARNFVFEGCGAVDMLKAEGFEVVDATDCGIKNENDYYNIIKDADAVINTTVNDYLKVILDGNQTVETLNEQGFRTKLLFEGYHDGLPRYQIIDIGYEFVVDYYDYVAAVVLPAGEIIPDKIGTTQVSYHDDEYIYLIDGIYNALTMTETQGMNMEPTEVTSETEVCVISKAYCDAYDARMLEEDETFTPSKILGYDEYADEMIEEYYDSSWELLLSEFSN